MYTINRTVKLLALASLIGCATTPEILVDAPMVEKVLRERKQTPMFFIDIGDQRNFDSSINDIDNAYLYNIDDLQGVADDNLQERANEAAKAEEIVHEEVHRFLAWLDSLEQGPTIAALKQRFEDVRLKELEKSLSGSLKDLTEKQREALEEMTMAIVNKLLHNPITFLKNPQTQQEEDVLYVAVLKKIFDLDRK
jgi:glutamyl-tRNA reductase